MIPYKSSLATAVPSSVEARLEIAVAIRALTEDRDKALRPRQAEIASIRRELEKIARDIAKLRRATSSPILSALRKYGYNPDEPRIPKHNSGGGQWTDNGTQFAASGTDDAPSILISRGGHHFVPKAVYNELPLKPETKQVFDDARTGPLKAARHGWSPEHADYNQAVSDAFKQFLNKYRIQPEDMTPDQAQQFVFEVIGSHDPRIRDFNLKLYRRETLYYIMHHLLLMGPLEMEGGSDD